MAAINFDATNIKPADDFTPLPAGDYLVVIIDSNMAPTKNGLGQSLNLTLQVIDGPHQERLLWARLILVHDNAKTVDIAQRQLSAICHAVGILQVQDSAVLHGKPIKVRVKYVEADGQYPAKNEITSYKPATATSTPAPAAPAAAAHPWNAQPSVPPAAPAWQVPPAAPVAAQAPAAPAWQAQPAARQAPPINDVAPWLRGKAA